MEEAFGNILYIILNFEEYLTIVLQQYSLHTYFLVFLIIFLEAASIVTSFLPGDSLIFVTGTVASVNLINVLVTFIILCIAVLLGDAINFYVGKLLGKKLLKAGDGRFFKREYIIKAHEFYENHGKSAVIMGRFIPVVRSFIAFVAGFSSMNFYNFIAYATIGSILRVCLVLFSGYFFGSLQIVRDNFEIAIISVALITTIPALIGIIKSALNKKRKN